MLNVQLFSLSCKERKLFIFWLLLSSKSACKSCWREKKYTRNSLKVPFTTAEKFIKKVEIFFYDPQSNPNTMQPTRESFPHVFSSISRAACGALNHSRRVNVRARVKAKRGSIATSCEHWMPKWGKTEAEIKLFYDERKLPAVARAPFLLTHSKHS